MLLIYTGSGKGKTSASVGQLIRAHGQGFTVAFGQFMKRDALAGEQIFLQSLLQDNFFAGGLGFYRNKENTEEKKQAHQAAALAVCQWLEEKIQHSQLVVADELLYALGAGLLVDEQVQKLVDLGRKTGCHLVFSGRGLPEWLAEQADLVTEMTEIKHHAKQGVTAQKGIEF